MTFNEFEKWARNHIYDSQWIVNVAIQTCVAIRTIKCKTEEEYKKYPIWKFLKRKAIKEAIAEKIWNDSFKKDFERLIEINDSQMKNPIYNSSFNKENSENLSEITLK